MTDLPLPNIERFLAYAKVIKLKAKATVFDTGEASNSIFYIKKGTVVVIMKDHNGNDMIIDYLSEGEFFGELGIYDIRESKRSATVIVRTACELGEMRYERFLELVKIYPNLMRELDFQVATRLKETTRRVIDLSSLDVSGRITNCLLDLCKLPSAVQVENGVKIKVSRKDVAKIVGCTRETVGRVLQDMQEQGKIESSGMTQIIIGAKKDTKTESLSST